MNTELSSTEASQNEREDQSNRMSNFDYPTDRQQLGSNGTGLYRNNPDQQQYQPFVNGSSRYRRNFDQQYNDDPYVDQPYRNFQSRSRPFARGVSGRGRTQRAFTTARPTGRAYTALSNSTNPISKSQRRRRNRLLKLSQPMQMTEVMNPNVYPLPGTTDTGYKLLAKRIADIKPGSLTKQGMDFLACAFAPTDFANMSIDGIPDAFQGQTLVKQHRLVTSYIAPSGEDVYILLAPIPGVAYAILTTTAGTPVPNTGVFNCVYYSDSNVLFGGSPTTQADIVTKFRFISNHIEIVPTVNQMNWTGNIQAWKIPLSVQIRQNVTVGNLFGLNGIQGVVATNANQYTAPFNLGVYTAAYNSTCNFDFNDVLEEVSNLPAVISLVAGDYGQIASTDGIPGLDANFETVVIKITGVGPNSLDSMLIKTWACVEYKVNAGTVLYEYQTVSPQDELAMKLYREIILMLPVGVAFTENASFWSRVLSIIRDVSGGLVNLPGAYGSIARGVNLTSNGLLGFTDNS